MTTTPTDQTHTYSGQPGTSPLDAVRTLIGDTGPDTWLLPDETILWAISEEGAGRRAAASCCEIIATRYTGSRSISEKKVGDLLIRYGVTSKSNADGWLTMAKVLRRRSARGAMPSAGGIDVADRADESDTGLLQPSFTREMDNFQRGESNLRAADEFLTGPP